MKCKLYFLSWFAILYYYLINSVLISDWTNVIAFGVANILWIIIYLEIGHAVRNDGETQSSVAESK